MTIYKLKTWSARKTANEGKLCKHRRRNTRKVNLPAKRTIIQRIRWMKFTKLTGTIFNQLIGIFVVQIFNTYSMPKLLRRFLKKSPMTKSLRNIE